MPSLAQRLFRRAFRPVALAYYRWSYGESGVWGRALAPWVARWEATSERGDVPLDKAVWETQYRAGRWDLLRDPAELARYSLLAGYLRHLGPSSRRSARSVLDVGCGEGLLWPLLAPVGGADEPSYLGIDLSEAAIASACERYGDSPRARFLAADAETYTPPEPCDAVVLNECLYYLREPLAQAQRYLALLRPGGLLLISMFASPRTRAIRRELARELPLVTEVELRGPRGVWQVLAFRAPGADE